MSTAKNNYITVLAAKKIHRRLYRFKAFFPAGSKGLVFNKRNQLRVRAIYNRTVGSKLIFQFNIIRVFAGCLCSKKTYPSFFGKTCRKLNGRHSSNKLPIRESFTQSFQRIYAHCITGYDNYLWRKLQTDFFNKLSNTFYNFFMRLFAIGKICSISHVDTLCLWSPLQKSRHIRNSANAGINKNKVSHFYNPISSC